MYKGWLSLLLLSLLSGCASQVQQRVMDTASLPQFELNHTAQVTLPTVEAIYALSDEQQKAFLDFFNSDEVAALPKNQRVVRFLIHTQSDFTYNGKTRIASEAFDLKSGNCLTLAILTKALAEIANVPYSFQMVTSAPVYKKVNSVMMVSKHVRTKLFDPDYVRPENTIVINRPHVVVDYFRQNGDYRGRKVSSDELNSMYFRNLSADALRNSELSLSLMYAKRAVELAPESTENIATLALVLTKNGKGDIAEQFYQYAMDWNVFNTTLLNNYAIYLRRKGDEDKAREVSDLLISADDKDPYSWIFLGDLKIKERNYHLAKVYYNKAIEHAPYLDDAYLGLAKSEFGQGHYPDARNALKKAVELAWFNDERQLYQAKLNALNKLD